MTVIQGNFLAVAVWGLRGCELCRLDSFSRRINELKTSESGIFHHAEWNISSSSWYVSLYVVYASDVHWGMFAALLRCIEPSLDVPFFFTFDTPLSRCCVCLLPCLVGSLSIPDPWHSKTIRRFAAVAWLLPNSQVLDKPRLDFSQDVVPSRRFGSPVGLGATTVTWPLDGWRLPVGVGVGCGRVMCVFPGIACCFRHSPAPQRHDPRNEILQALDAYELGDPGGTGAKADSLNSWAKSWKWWATTHGVINGKAHSGPGSPSHLNCIPLKGLGHSQGV